MAGKRETSRARFTLRVRDNQRHMGVRLEGEGSLALQPPVRSRHLTMIRGKDYDRISPQIHVIHNIYKLLKTAFVVSDGVQVIIVEDVDRKNAGSGARDA